MKNILEEKNRIVEDDKIQLQFMPWQMLGNGIISLLYSFAGIVLIIYGIGIYYNEKGWWLGIITIPLGIFFILDFPLYLNHFFHEAFRKVTFNKTNKSLRIEIFGKASEIDLKLDHYFAIRYIPRIALFEKVPGAGYGKILIVRGNEKFSFSETILDKSYLWLNLINLLPKENIKEVKAQFNFIW